MKPITFGIKTAPQYTTYEAILQVWQQADANPAFDHFVYTLTYPYPADIVARLADEVVGVVGSDHV